MWIRRSPTTRARRSWSTTLDLGGPDRLKQLQPVSSADFAPRFEQIYGKPLDQADREWRAFCASFR